LLSAESVQDQRRRLSIFLKRAQILLLIVNVVHFCISCVSAAWNGVSIDYFSQSLHAYLRDDSDTGSTLLSEGYRMSANGDLFQGVSC
jgi:hypothetical protein